MLKLGKVHSCSLLGKKYDASLSLLHLKKNVLSIFAGHTVAGWTEKIM